MGGSKDRQVRKRQIESAGWVCEVDTHASDDCDFAGEQALGVGRRELARDLLEAVLSGHGRSGCGGCRVCLCVGKGEFLCSTERKDKRARGKERMRATAAEPSEEPEREAGRGPGHGSSRDEREQYKSSSIVSA